eukprot:TRINITY_DN10802_c0_g1_i2.p1 TRINITY_DN10802_c0_g1~~TRINITY_DN10802_c0_g1_i2.p1  ORF type:complete len:106 (+),score=26.63 TRINITY_DN10802_c0_g1_i2:161-478(+)
MCIRDRVSTQSTGDFSSRAMQPTEEPAMVDESSQQRITDGFVINWMNMSDGDTGQVHWESTNILPSADEEQVAHLPKVLLACNFVGREVNFSSCLLYTSPSPRDS